MQRTLLFFFLSIANILSAQIDAHYWTHQFGGHALLLNGAVIANTDDETAIFYNPGTMAMKDNNNDLAVSLSFLTPTYSTLDTKNYFGEGSNIEATDLGFTPGLAALGFNPFGKKNFRMALTSFTRYQSKINFRYRTVVPIVDVENQLYEANLSFKRKLSETWLGVGAAWRFFNVIGFGVSQFATFHSQETDLRVDQDILTRNTPTELLGSWRNRDKYYFNTLGRMITKVGLSIQAGQFKFGLTATSPSYGGVYSKSEYEKDELKKYTDGTTTLINDRAEGKVERFKTPFSLGAGLEFPLYDALISLSGEYFFGVSDYTVFEINNDPYGGLVENPPTTDFTLRNGNHAVFNLAFGLQAELSKKSTMVFGMRSDFNQQKEQDGNNALQILSTTPSVIHVSLGNVLEIWKSRFSFGFDYGIGIRNSQSPTIDVYSTNLDNLFNPPVERTVKWRFQSFVLILAYDFSYRKKQGKE